MTDNTLTDTLEYIKYTLIVALHPSVFKSIFSFFFVVFSFLFDVNQASSLLALFILILLDFVSGVAAARFNDQPIRSSKIKHTAIKITAYFAVISGAHLVEHGLSNFLGILDETVIAFFLLTELISLLENVGKMGIDTPKKLINKLTDARNKL